MRLPDQLTPRETERDQSIMRFITDIDAQAFAQGIQLSLETDFHSLKKINDDVGKLPLTPNFDPDKIDIGPANGIWMKGVDVSGNIVFTQAARIYDCRDTTLALLHQSLRAFYSDPKSSAEDGENCICEAPITHAITGDVAYHGEIWLKTDYRARGLTTTLPRLMLAVIMMRWAPDYVFGMTQPGICTKGVSARYGYRNMQPRGMIWTVPSTGTLDEWIVWNDAHDLNTVIRQP